MDKAQTIGLDEISDAIEPLNDEQRALVIDFARMLKHRDDIRIAEDVPFEGSNLEGWRERVTRRAARELERSRADLEAMGVSPDGTLAASDWPNDMLAGSKTSVAT